MSTFYYRPLSLLDEVQRSLFGQTNSESAAMTRTWSPAVDVTEDDKGYYLAVDLPGVSKDNVSVTAHERILTISGDREWDVGERKEAVQERWRGKFERRFTLPESADADRIEAKFENGVLAIHLPKLESAEPRRITVQ